MGFNKSLKWLVNYKFNQIEIGKNVYEHYVRHSKNPSPKKISPVIYRFFSEALMYNFKYNQMFRDTNISFWLQSEAQFIPFRVFFQNTLKNGSQILSRFGLSNVSVKKFDHYNQRNLNRSSYNKKLINYFFFNHRRKLINKANKKINYLLKKIGSEDRLLDYKFTRRKFFTSKKMLCEFF